jgi:hypothetical protein
MGFKRNEEKNAGVANRGKKTDGKQEKEREVTEQKEESKMDTGGEENGWRHTGYSTRVLTHTRTPFCSFLPNVPPASYSEGPGFKSRPAGRLS